jgi:hypothetical protein
VDQGHMAVDDSTERRGARLLHASQDTMPGGIPCLARYHAGWDPMPGTCWVGHCAGVIPCRLGYPTGWDRLPCSTPYARPTACTVLPCAQAKHRCNMQQQHATRKGHARHNTIQHGLYNMQQTTCKQNMQHTLCNLEKATCTAQHAAYSMQHATTACSMQHDAA